MALVVVVAELEVQLGLEGYREVTWLVQLGALVAHVQPREVDR